MAECVAAIFAEHSQDSLQVAVEGLIIFTNVT